MQREIEEIIDGRDYESDMMAFTRSSEPTVEELNRRVRRDETTRAL